MQISTPVHSRGEYIIKEERLIEVRFPLTFSLKWTARATSSSCEYFHLILLFGLHIQ
jgi:hypothetical protein